MIWPKEAFRESEITTRDPQRRAYTSYLTNRYGSPKPHSATLTCCLRDFYSCDPRKPGKTRPLLSLFFEKLPIELIFEVCTIQRSFFPLLTFFLRYSVSSVQMIFSGSHEQRSRCVVY